MATKIYDDVARFNGAVKRLAVRQAVFTVLVWGEVLEEVPGVAEIAVAGLPVLGEVPVAFVVSSNDSERPPRQTLLKHAALNLPKHKMIRDVYFVDALPRTPSGKIKRTQLRQMAETNQQQTKDTDT